MAHYLISYDEGHYDDSPTARMAYEIVEAENAREAILDAVDNDGLIVSVWTLRSAEPRQFRLSTETVTRLEAL